MKSTWKALLVACALGVIFAVAFAGCGVDALREPCSNINGRSVCASCAADIRPECNAAETLMEDQFTEGFMDNAEEDKICEAFRAKWLPFCP
jgi:hypothetical protein